MEAYKDLGRFLDTADTEPATLPGGLEEVVQRAEVFSADNAAGNHLKVTIRPDGTDSQKGWVSIVGEGVSGGYEEQNQVSYQGPPISFLISPKLLLEVSKKQSTIRIGERKICVDGGKFKFMAATEMPAAKEAPAKEA
jgi:hypothetical protein